MKLYIKLVTVFVKKLGQLVDKQYLKFKCTNFLSFWVTKAFSKANFPHNLVLGRRVEWKDIISFCTVLDKSFDSCQH